MSRFLLIVSFVWCCCSCISLHKDNNMSPEMPGGEYTHADVENLALLCKVWGFMKYYHPSVRAGEYDWDRELLCIMPSLVSLPSKEKRNEVLVKWIDQFDFKKKNGYKRSVELSEEYGMYRQYYCGCVFSIVCVRRIR